MCNRIMHIDAKTRYEPGYFQLPIKKPNPWVPGTYWNLHVLFIGYSPFHPGICYSTGIPGREVPR